MEAELSDSSAGVGLSRLVLPTQIWLLDFRYLVAALLVLILSGFSLKGIVGLGLGAFAFCICFFFLYRGVKRILLTQDRMVIYSLLIKSLELQITQRGACRGRLIAMNESCLLVFESFKAQTPRPTGRACRHRKESVELLLPRLNTYNHPSYVMLIDWLESKGVAMQAPLALDNEVEELDLTGPRFFVFLLIVFAVLLAALAFFSSHGTHPL